ncbi:hypothetical protein C1H46_005528 [Malus baccata]|uniref:Uncharacterized protein n=1 Tax=Malus baccata TaxID=106549 RepID=A0A540NCZ0_MALBA|nr:hypothetical protein C1H46_005528 [Malus baccata]
MGASSSGSRGGEAQQHKATGNGPMREMLSSLLASGIGRGREAQHRGPRQQA